MRDLATSPGRTMRSGHAARADEQTAGSLLLAATGDSLLTQRLSSNSEPEFLGVIEILRAADVAFTNLETTIHDSDAAPAADSGGTWMVSPPHVAEELEWAGIRLLARANNHAMDWGVEGMRETTRVLDARALTHAGVGEDLAGARQPVYRQTPAGKLALVSASSTFPAWGRAGRARGAVSGRPGLNPLRWSKVHLVGPQAFAAMRTIAAELGVPAGGTDQPLHLFGTTFVPWQKTAAGVEADPADLAGNLASVCEARSRADWVVVSLHTHEDGGNPFLPSPFAVAFARQCVENGADVVLMHGAHVLRGIEIYRGKPVFYGLGNFIYQARQVARIPADALERLGLPVDASDDDAIARMEQWAASSTPGIPGRSPHLFGSAYSFLPVVRFADRTLQDIRLYPLTLGPDLPRTRCGYPRLAQGRLAEEIIALLRRLSAPMCTAVTTEDGRGIVNPDLATGR